MKRKLFTLFLGATLALGVLTACGETATDDGTGTGGTGTGGASPADTLSSPEGSPMDMEMSPAASPSS